MNSKCKMKKCIPRETITPKRLAFKKIITKQFTRRAAVKHAGSGKFLEYICSDSSNGNDISLLAGIIIITYNMITNAKCGGYVLHRCNNNSAFVNNACEDFGYASADGLWIFKTADRTGKQNENIIHIRYVYKRCERTYYITIYSYPFTHAFRSRSPVHFCSPHRSPALVCHKLL